MGEKREGRLRHVLATLHECDTAITSLYYPGARK